MGEKYDGDRLASAVARSVNWSDLMRRLGLKVSGGQRRVLQAKVNELGLDTSHFKQRSPWRKYPDEAVAAAAATSTTLREVVTKLGAAPATGTLSHIARRIAAAGIDISHFPGMNREHIDLPFTADELTVAAAATNSVRGIARLSGSLRTVAHERSSEECCENMPSTPATFVTDGRPSTRRHYVRPC